jgi:hypothetical protein
VRGLVIGCNASVRRASEAASRNGIFMLGEYPLGSRKTQRSGIERQRGEFAHAAGGIRPCLLFERNQLLVQQNHAFRTARGRNDGADALERLDMLTRNLLEAFLRDAK